MKGLLKLMTLCFMILSLVGCGSYEEGANLSKNGAKYEIVSEAIVYYPKQWKVVESDSTEVAIHLYNGNHEVLKDPKAIQVDFYNEDASEMLRLNRTSVHNDNSAEQLIQLFCADLALMGIDVTYQEEVLNNGASCYEVLGVYKAKDKKFKWIVTYKENTCYTYFYETTSSIFDEKIESMSMYLYSMDIKE